jgi:preprotein translocase subunit SecE
MVASLKTFIDDVQKEMKKVTWPTKEQLREATTVTIVICVLISLLLGVLDFGITKFIGLIFN